MANNTDKYYVLQFFTDGTRGSNYLYRCEDGLPLVARFWKRKNKNVGGGRSIWKEKKGGYETYGLLCL